LREWEKKKKEGKRVETEEKLKRVEKLKVLNGDRFGND